MKWLEAVRKWNDENNKGGKYRIPTKGTPAYNEVMKMMGRAPAETSVPKAPPPEAPKPAPLERYSGSEGKKLRLNELMGLLEAQVADLTRVAATSASPAKRRDLEKKASDAKKLLAKAKAEYAAL